MLKRRNLLKLAAAGGAVAALPLGRAMSALASSSSPADAVVPFTVALPVPQVLQPTLATPFADFYRLTAQPATAQLVPGVTTPVLTYNGSFVGPTIKARRGKPVYVCHANNLTTDSVLHLHGGRVSPGNDGHPLDLVAAGATRTYEYPNEQDATTLWYHDHTHHSEAENVYRGLSGFYLIEDDAERRLGLPSGQYDVPLQFRDVKIADDGTLTYNVYGFYDRPTLLVNGAARPYFPVAARKYRFRLLNSAIERNMTFALSDGSPFQQIGSDQGLLGAPASLTELSLWSAERADIVIDFSRYPVGSSVVLQNKAAFPNDTSADLLRFDVVRTAPDTSTVPARLRDLPAVPAAAVEREFSLYLDRTTGHHVINGLAFDPARIDITPKLGTTEIWKITNTDTQLQIPHSMHPHLVRFRVLDRAGVPAGPSEAGFKDTVSLAPGATVRIAVTFDAYAGKYVYHCHMLSHSTSGMMGQMQIG
ncbi:multicopper oxidase domain-containing protein [Amycolatopsis sp. NPDC021455]|uniref:multicopper oxidase family protein n=1 Tax=Amycolatopsis sp. NPDC021455 TaxID=3154901 RepID=UPI0033DDD928